MSLQTVPHHLRVNHRWVLVTLLIAVALGFRR